MKLDVVAAYELSLDATLGAGGGFQMAHSLARATVAAERVGKKSLGFSHLLDYLIGLEEGRINGTSIPVINFPTPASVRVDVQKGIAQLGFDQAFPELTSRCNLYGMSVLLLSNCYTTGELGYYTRRLAEEGYVALATTNAAAQMTTRESGKPVFGTNPISLSVPRKGKRPFVIDQACSATAYVNVRHAADHGQSIPEGWALDKYGNPTTDALAATLGLLLPFGGRRGANIALMVEILTAGLAGGNWSTEAAHFSTGTTSPGVGLFIALFNPDLLSPGMTDRVERQLLRLGEFGVSMPSSSVEVENFEIDDATWVRLQMFL